MDKRHAQDIVRAARHIRASDPHAFEQSASETSNPRGKKWKKALVRVGIAGATFALTQIPVLGEAITGIGLLVVPETELGGAGLGVILAWKFGKHVDKWFGLDDHFGPETGKPLAPLASNTSRDLPPAPPPPR